MNIAIILAAGSSIRFSPGTPKQFVRIAGKPLLCYSLEAFEAHSEIGKILIVTQERYIKKTQAIVDNFGYDKVIDIIPGGATRQASSLEALKYLQYMATSEDIVLIHDAARPLLPQKVITENITLARKHGAAVTAVPCLDTICESEDGAILSKNLDRNTLFQAQTPQSFRFGTIFDAHREALIKHLSVSDDAQLLVDRKRPVYLAKGDRFLIKITTREDLAIIKQWLKEWEG